MNIQKRGEIAGTGRMVLIYGPTGVGKTASSLASSFEPILTVWNEQRDQTHTLKAVDQAIGREVQVDSAPHTSWDDTMDWLRNIDNTKNYATLNIDNLSYLMNVGLKSEIEDEIFDARDPKKKDVKKLINATKLTLEGYGALAGQMNRLFLLLGQHAKAGRIVIITALSIDKPTWDADLASAPLLAGKEFASNMPSYMDLIGYARAKFEPNGKPSYPPQVSFQRRSTDVFECKYTGLQLDRPAIGPLHIMRMFKKFGYPLPYDFNWETGERI